MHQRAGQVDIMSTWSSGVCTLYVCFPNTSAVWGAHPRGRDLRPEGLQGCASGGPFPLAPRRLLGHLPPHQQADGGGGDEEGWGSYLKKFQRLLLLCAVCCERDGL